MVPPASPSSAKAAPARAYEQTVDVETPELVVLTYSIAGIGSRVLAALTDLAISAGLMAALFVAVLILAAGGRFGVGARAVESWGAAVLILAQFGVMWGYYVLFEGFMDGQTPGKRIHRLRVVREGGYSVTFAASAVRNLVRIIDMQPLVFYLVGLGSILVTKRGRRLGDVVAGTLVVREDIRPVAPPDSTPPRERVSGAPLQTLLSEDEYLVLQRFVERWSTLEPQRRMALGAQLAARFKSALPDDNRPIGRQLLELHAREQLARARGAVSRDESGAGRERQAIVAASVPRWNAFAMRLAAAQRHGLRGLGEAGVRDFAAEYRALATDLARLRTASGGRALDELFQLGRLVAGAHNLLYGDRGVPVRRAVRSLFIDVPREIRRSAAPIALAALLLFGPALIAGVAVIRTPAVADQLLPQAMLRRAGDAARRVRAGEGYIDDPQLFRPVMASAIVSNNVQISFAAFAGGITAGLLTAFLLVANGISFGSVVGLYLHNGAGRLLLAFVAPHGVLELFAICIAAGGGFLLASAILLPGPRSRRRALVENGRRAIRLIAGSTALLLVAGTIEGFLSPIEWWPIEGKLAVSGTTLVLLVAYLRGGRPRKAGSPPDEATIDAPGALALGAVTVRRGP